MAVYRYQFYAQNERGDVIPGAVVTVRRESDSGIASIFSDNAGATPKSNPFVCDDNGYGFFYVAPGTYRIAVSSGIYSTEWRDVYLGLDIDQSLLPNRTGNLLINGDFQLNQRGFAGGALSAGVYGFDRWKADTGGADVSVSSFTVTLASGKIVQVVEPAVFGQASFSGLPVTFSVDSPSADMLVEWHGTSGVISAGSGRKSVTLTSVTTGNATLKISKNAAGSVTFGRVVAELGTVADPRNTARPLSQELSLAQRYFQKSYNLAVAPGTVTTLGRQHRNILGAYVFYVNTQSLMSRMRVAPTVTLYSPQTGASGNMARHNTADTYVTDMSSGSNGISDSTFNVYMNAVGVAGDSAYFHFTADAEI